MAPFNLPLIGTIPFPVNIVFCFIGCLVGTLIGLLPGLGPVATIAILLPITFNLDPVAALIMLAGIYYGAQYGGSTTAILINISPGRGAPLPRGTQRWMMAIVRDREAPSRLRVNSTLPATTAPGCGGDAPRRAIARNDAIDKHLQQRPSSIHGCTTRHPDYVALPLHLHDDRPQDLRTRLPAEEAAHG